MKIAIDCSKLNVNERSGTHRFLIGFLNELSLRDNLELTFYFNQIDLIDKTNADFNFLKKGKLIELNRMFYTQIGLLKELNKYDYFIFPWQTIPFLNFFLKRNVVAIIHDSGYSFKTKFFTFLTQIFASKLFSVSQSTADSLIRKSLLITEGVDQRIFYKLRNSDLIRDRKENNIPEDFILSVGRIEERKNIFNNLRAFSKIIKFYPSLKYCFIGKFNIEEKIIYSFIDSLGINRDKILFMNYVDDKKLNIYLNSCEFLVFTSQDEGFGLPVLEAYSVGKWVILSKIKQLAEFSLTAKQLVDWDSPDDIAKTIVYFLTNKLKLKKEFNPNQILNKYSWKESVDLFLKGIKNGK